jgi:hypothetical protein
VLGSSLGRKDNGGNEGIAEKLKQVHRLALIGVFYDQSRTSCGVKCFFYI